MKALLHFTVVAMCLMTSCQSYNQKEYEDYFEQISRLTYSNNNNYWATDYFQSSCYHIFWESSEYDIDMPLSKKHITRIRQSSNQKTAYKTVYYLSEICGPFLISQTTINHLEEICNDFKSIWKIDSHKIYLRSLMKGSGNEVFLHICWKPLDEDYCLMVSPKGLNALPTFQDLTKKLNIRDRMPDSGFIPDGYIQLNDSTYYKRLSSVPRVN